MKNILFLLLDCLRADLVFGDRRRAPTPAIDRLKQRGISFTQAISSATMTSPCISSLFTGCYPHRTGVHNLRGDTLNPALPTLAELLRQAGYHTTALVTGPLWEGIGVERGFDEYVFREPTTALTAEWRDRVASRLSSAVSDGPWFLYAHFFDLHVPRVVARELDKREFGATLYERAVASLDRRLAEFLGLIDWDKTTVVLMADHGEAYPSTPWLEWREKIYQDVILGKRPPFMRLGIRRDPTVKVWTRLKRLTHMGHGFGLSDSQVRVPLVIAGMQAGRAGQVVADQVRQVDVMPTLLELAGVTPPADLSGSSLLPLVLGQDNVARPAYMEARAFGRDPNFFLRGLRTQEWKYVDSPTGTQPPHLYHLPVDPEEKVNVIADCPDVANELRKLLEAETGKGAPRVTSGGWTDEEAGVVEERLRNLGYF